MADILALYNKMNKPEIDLDLLFDNLFEEVFPKIKQAIRERWKRGEQPDGNIIGLYAVYSYKTFKEQINPLAKGFVDLTLTGALGEKITFAMFGTAEYEIFSRDYKFGKIVEKYGDYNFNISEKERQKLAYDITKQITEKVIKNYYYNG